MRSKMKQWADHRLGVVGFENWKAVEKETGLPGKAIRHFNRVGSIRKLKRSSQKFFSEAMKVPLIMLEKLDRGEIEWIEDSVLYDCHRPAGKVNRKDNNPDQVEARPVLDQERGTPIIGRILESGALEIEEDQEFHRRLPVRYGNGREIYALDNLQSNSMMIFENVPLHQFKEGLAVVYISDGFAAVGRLGRVIVEGNEAFMDLNNGTRESLAIENIQRIGCYLTTWKS